MTVTTTRVSLLEIFGISGDSYYCSGRDRVERGEWSCEQIGLPGWVELPDGTGESANTYYGTLPP